MLVLPSLAGCSEGGETLRTPQAEQSRQFSDADKIAARALSIGNDEAMTNADSPYAQALLCKNGVDIIADRISQAGGFGEQQMQGIELAQAYYDRQVRSLAASEGKSASEIEGDLEQTATDNPDVGANARIAIACLQNLQELG